MKKLILPLVTACFLIAGSFIAAPTASAQTGTKVEQRQGQLSIGGQALTDTAASYLRTIKYLTVAPDKQTSASFQSSNPGVIRQLESPIRRQIFDAMSQNSERFAFATLADAQENFAMRVAALDFMTRMGQGASSGVDFDYHGPSVPAVADSRFWISTGGFRFRTRPGVSASDAIDGITGQRFRGECLGAVHITVLQAARQAIGAPRFNQLHPDGLAVPGPSAETHWRTGSLNSRDMVPGDRVYIQNKDDYQLAAKAGGYWPGENALYMGRWGGQQRFSGMGLYHKTEAELRQALKTHYLADMQKYEPGVQHRIEDADVRWTSVARLETGSRAPTSPVPPGPGPVLVAAGSLVNTTWIGQETLAGYGRLEFRFQSNGRVVMIDARGQSTGSYTQTGQSVTLSFGSASTAVYSGTIAGNTITGPARVGQTNWNFTVTR
jgi:hypothetical protein